MKQLIFMEQRIFDSRKADSNYDDVHYVVGTGGRNVLSSTNDAVKGNTSRSHQNKNQEHKQFVV